MAAESRAVLRSELRRRRARTEDRERKDDDIFAAVTGWRVYREAAVLLCYVSTAEEPDTRKILTHALREGKAVFVPRCLPGGRLAFHRIDSLSELRPAGFGLLEPDGERCPRWDGGREPKTLCLTPGLAFDRRGYRIGYGKGYYDRFLAEHRLCAAGLCYGEMLLPRLPAETWDRRVDFLITEEGVFPSGEDSPGKEGL